MAAVKHYNILIIGAAECGKTAIATRFIHKRFQPYYSSTDGMELTTVLMPLMDTRLWLYDYAGSRKLSYNVSVGRAAFIVCDVSREPTLEAALEFKKRLDSRIKIPCILLANKWDLLQDGQTKLAPKLDALCKKQNFHAWIETSAKTGKNIELAFETIVSLLRLGVLSDMVNGLSLNPSESERANEDDQDLQIIYQQSVPKRDEEAAKSLKLPVNFYSYKNRSYNGEIVTVE